MFPFIESVLCLPYPKTLWLDQRGTGMSTYISADMLASKSDHEKAAYLKHFRADSIGTFRVCYREFTNLHTILPQ